METELNKIFSLEGKVVIITGAGGFLGKKHAEAVAEMGGTPLLLDINIDATDNFISTLNREFGVNAAAYQVDITSEEAVVSVLSKIVAEYGHIDGLINNASLNPKMESKKETEKLKAAASKPK